MTAQTPYELFVSISLVHPTTVEHAELETPSGKIGNFYMAVCQTTSQLFMQDCHQIFTKYFVRCTDSEAHNLTVRKSAHCD